MVRTTVEQSIKDGARRRWLKMSTNLFGAVVVALFGLTASVVAALFVADSAEDADVSDFRLDAADRIRIIESSLESEAGILASLQHFYGASITVEAHEFAAFAERELSRRPGIEAVEWVLRVTRDELPGHAALCEELGVADSTIRRPDSSGALVPIDTAAGEVWYPMLFVASLSTVEPATGLDRGADSDMRRALEKARDSGRPVATEGARSPDGDMRVHVFQPVYAKDQLIDRVERRREHLHGFVVSRLMPGRIIEHALAALGEAPIDVEVFDTSAATAPGVSGPTLHVHHNESSSSLGPDELPRFDVAEPVRVADRRWTIRCRPTAAYVAQRSAAAAIATFAAGALITLLAAAYVRMLLYQRQKVTQLVQRRTSELAERNADLRAEIRHREQVEDELQRSNAELAQFAYVASHDLQEPLRMVASYCTLLQRKHGEEVGENGRKYIHYAVDGAQRMQALISDLLEYSRINTRGERTHRVELNEVVDQATANLTAAIEESGGAVTRGDLPAVEGVAPHLLQLFQNLMANALKFRGDAPPEVEITCDVVDGERVFSVRDNGIGIADEHRERVFEVFKRLHARTEFAGTGIGLAVCRKVVENHGGRIWIESEPGRGTTFLFTLGA